MTVIERVRSLRGAGVLADRNAKDQGPPFHRYNLIYGFNGSGKSTLSRLFACLQAGVRREEIPDGCSFEIEMDDGTIYGCPGNLAGLEKRVCVFNSDFVERNLRWAEGRATSIFYISEEQSGSAAELQEKQVSLQTRKETETAQNKVLAASEKALKTFKTERARLISGKLHVPNRRYEAPQLQADYEKLSFDRSSILTDEVLDDFEEVARQSAPPAALRQAIDSSANIKRLIGLARSYAELSISQMVLEEAERHPSMVPWLKTGLDYHAEHGLRHCLLCGNELTAERKAKLAVALDDKLTALLTDLRETADSLSGEAAALQSQFGRPQTSEIEGSLRTPYNRALDELAAASQPLMPAVEEAKRVISERLAMPTVPVPHHLPNSEELAETCSAVGSKLAAINGLIAKHNAAAADFGSSQAAARDAIKKHFLAEGFEEFESLQAALAEAQKTSGTVSKEVQDLEADIASLTTRVRTHGPAANKITKLVQAYLGHSELAIVPADEGYELHRHRKLVKGPPSEGEKTAIALCYFLSTLEADGRCIDDLIVVVDDPISSLDTKALNYASSLIRSVVERAAQVFVLTHNQHCMNEFKKAWQRLTKEKEEQPATASLLFIDVTLPENSERREARIVEMPKHLRGYDSEYHFLCSKALQFEAAGEGYSEFWFMMPNVIRRVLDVFLGFKEPGSHSPEQKLDALAKKLPQLDPIRVKALHRLVQVESHSDNLDDLIAHSSMTIEETRDANAAMLALMEAADAGHMAAIRSQCKAQ